MRSIAYNCAYWSGFIISYLIVCLILVGCGSATITKHCDHICADQIDKAYLGSYIRGIK